jgi:hypothetical protein
MYLTLNKLLYGLGSDEPFPGLGSKLGIEVKKGDAYYNFMMPVNILKLDA